MHEFLPHLPYILYGALVTLKYSVIGIIFGFIIGTSLAFCKIAHSKALRFFAAGYTSIFRGTPLLVQLSLIYFGLPALLDIKLSVFFSGALAFSLNSGAYVSEKKTLSLISSKARRQRFWGYQLTCVLRI